MGAVRRYVLPAAWLVVFAVIAAALFKLAFVDGLTAEAAQEQPSAELVTPTVSVERATITNVVQVKGSVVSDPAVAVRSTAEGTVNHVFVEEGATVAEGDPLFQVRKLVEPAPSTALEPPPVPVDDADEDTGNRPEPAPQYTYTNVVATAAGKLAGFDVLLDQQVSVGTDAATIAPGTFSVSGTLTTDQQFRILGRPSKATVTITGGPAPFECGSVTVGEAAPADTAAQPEPADPFGGPFGGAAASETAGTVNCAVPTDVSVFAGLGASIDISAGTAEDVLAVPTTAVKGAVESGIVWVVKDDGGSAPEEREVTLGLNDGQQVEVSDGLEQGELVLQFVPGAPGQDPMGESGPFGMVGG
ncbi:hypothetical protein D477_012325 [Arthrobacter crystallopoietes BAB-32]|uniref:Multidrug resistance protein MdtA-like C-terminal permuted SH3 domain-containing protein n=1 Tax=Arthrobacter crystallopoietes BAB-32 TaxID=1246476 RepID=N1V1Q0_9MICC|nr:efflux RND transporter periplasmic adaptor subunit [Arthrobacter crystallopoietes]EMY33914.1 hypothetical protein D477_012325 [Arthrobacter crystallopoietes BAB-32]